MTMTDNLLLNNRTTTVGDYFDRTPPPAKRIRLTSDSACKRVAVAGATSFLQPKLHANRFLRVHRQILKSLYAEDPSASLDEEDPVDDTEWNCIDAFLREREAIQTMAAKVRHMGDVHEEALTFQGTEAAAAPHQDPPTLSMDVTAPVTSPITGRAIGSSCGLLTPSSKLTSVRSTRKIVAQPTAPPSTTASPLKHGSAGRRRLTWASATPIKMFHHPGFSAGKAGGRGIANADNDRYGDETDRRGDAFGIISGLLKHRHQIASNRLDRKSAPYRSLLLNVDARIDRLEARLKDLTEGNGGEARSNCIVNGDGKNNKTRAERGCSCYTDSNFGADWMAAKELGDESRVRIATKVSLWKVLFDDLKAATE
jgi:hypothetical protein